MKYTLLLTALVGMVAAQTLCPAADRVVKSSEVITAKNGATFTLSNVVCNTASNVTPVQARDSTLLEVRDMVEKRAASECTGSPCECGAACTGTACSRPSHTINVQDCEDLVTELLDTDGTFILPPQTFGVASLRTCEFAAFNNFVNTAAQFCFDDFGEGSLALTTTCGANAAVCTGTGRQFFYEQVAS